MNLGNKVALVTGASGGIGAAIAKLFAKNGATLSLVGKNEENLNKVADECKKTGSKVLAFEADVCNDGEVKNFFNKTLQEFGRIDVLINNAGICRGASLFKGDLLQTYDNVMSTNLRSVVHLTQLAAPHLVKTKGNIVNISGAGGTRVLGLVDFMTVCVSKAGMEHFSRLSALELASKGVRVNTVTAGPTRTNFFDLTDFMKNGTEAGWEALKQVTALNRVSEPEEVADLVLYVASDKAKGITGSSLLIDNGWVIKGA